MAAGQRKDGNGGTGTGPAGPAEGGVAATSRAAWPAMASGDRVLVTGPGLHRVSGRLDTITDDGTILWIHEDGGQGRRLIEFAAGYGVEKLP